jgi:DNA invertase Pin-like site-specific DNA recombinase
LIRCRQPADRRLRHAVGASQIGLRNPAFADRHSARRVLIAMFQMMGVFAEFERAMIQERVRAGLARARSEGKRLGRPPIAPALEKRIREGLATPGRPGIRVIAERFGVNPSTVQRISRPFDGASVAVA